MSIRSIFVFLILGIGLAFANDPATITAQLRPDQISQGQKGEILVDIRIADGFHLSDATSGIFEIEAVGPTGVTFGDPVTPEAEEDDYGMVFRGNIQVKVPVRVSAATVEGAHQIHLSITVQPCDETSGVCYPPEDHEMDLDLAVMAGSASDTGAGEGIAGKLTNALERGSILAFLIVFLGGVLTSLTPCVYPMIPITIAVIGAQAGGGKFKGFVLSLFYVLGIGITFSTLGVIAAKTGGLFGAYARHPVTMGLISVIFLAMGLSMLGAFVIQMPASLATKLRGQKRSGFLGAIVTGMLAGLVVSPCISPLLVVILAWVAQTGSILLGVGLLFSFAVGLGILFILIGTFSGVLKNLPKSGGWMELIERGFGILLVALAVVFLKPLLSALWYQWIWAGLLIIFGTFIGGFMPLTLESTAKQKLGKALGVLAVVIGASLVLTGFLQQHDSGVIPGRAVEIEETDGWMDSDVEGFAAARAEGKPVLMDFYADWCTACHELDEKVWVDPAIKAEMEKYVLVKLDLTKNDDRTKFLQTQYGVVGMPTVIFMTPSGEELFRFEGYHPANNVLPFPKKYSE